MKYAVFLAALAAVQAAVHAMPARFEGLGEAAAAARAAKAAKAAKDNPTKASAAAAAATGTPAGGTAGEPHGPCRPDPPTDDVACATPGDDDGSVAEPEGADEDRSGAGDLGNGKTAASNGDSTKPGDDVGSNAKPKGADNDKPRGVPLSRDNTQDGAPPPSAEEAKATGASADGGSASGPSSHGQVRHCDNCDVVNHYNSPEACGETESKYWKKWDSTLTKPKDDKELALLSEATKAYLLYNGPLNKEPGFKWAWEEAEGEFLRYNAKVNKKRIRDQKDVNGRTRGPI
ncbi:hypothetical protein CDD83_2491 [Cordyceps sp. RAO-2017]|nr:hypothetical protein CDD83_2491 [Cordyceps sp. RAO-2017]